MRILLTFTGFHDPYARGLVGDDEQPGPIISLLNARAFDLVYLLSTPNTERNTTATAAALKNRFEIRQLPVPLQDPTDYGAMQDHDSYGNQLGAMLCFLIFLDNLLKRIEGPGDTVWFWLSSGRWELILVFGVLIVVCQLLFWSGVVRRGHRGSRGE